MKYLGDAGVERLRLIRQRHVDMRSNSIVPRQIGKFGDLIILHGMKYSGHSHRVELFLNLLSVPYEYRAVDLRAGSNSRRDFSR
jgi:hypothetical protein